MLPDEPPPVNDTGPSLADAEPVLFDPADALTVGPSHFPDGRVMRPAPTATCAGITPGWQWLYHRRHDDRPATRGQVRRLVQRLAEAEDVIVELAAAMREGRR